MSILSNPVEILQALVRFDTTNPPGNEFLAINWARDFLANAGLESTLLVKDSNRPNLIARLRCSGSAPPLLHQGYVDVVTTAGQDWTYHPFSAEIHDNYV
jgi:acetylornithine deacetylase/succinyl-diaminopimelate desuccinylase-like protein